LDRLSKNKKGFFLMIEWDAHTNDPRKGLDNVVGLDKLIREMASKVNLKDTLMIFTADHSFDLHVRSGRKSEPLLQGLDAWKEKNAAQKQPYMELPNIRVHGSHTGEEVIVAAQGPGAERFQGFMPNTRIFDNVMTAFGWPSERK